MNQDLSFVGNFKLSLEHEHIPCVETVTVTVTVTYNVMCVLIYRTVIYHFLQSTETVT